MILTNFTLIDDISIRYNKMYLDLHNNFDFQGFSYNLNTRSFELIWSASKEDWASVTIDGFKLVFSGVTFLKFRERDSEVPFTEDSCLSNIGFMPCDDEGRKDFDSFLVPECITNEDDLTISFHSDFAIKINCQSVELVELKESL